jgi:DNA repair protein RecO (recombination protein O)
LDQLQEHTENFHLIFLIKLSTHLGFGPQNGTEVTGSRMLDADTDSLLSNLLKADYAARIVMGNGQRRELLDVLLQFYAQHIDALGEIRSVQVLREVLS